MAALNPVATLNPLIVIPARMHATRLPGKPLADIHGEARREGMITRVLGFVSDIGRILAGRRQRGVAALYGAARPEDSLQHRAKSLICCRV